MSPRPATPPDRAYVLRVAEEEAQGCRATLEAVLHMSQEPEARRARVRAWARIIAETGCKGTALAKAWGCSPESVWNAFSPKRLDLRLPRPPKPLYDAFTIEHLRSAHGDARTAEIIAGRDQATEQDIARWRAIGGRK